MRRLLTTSLGLILGVALLPLGATSATAESSVRIHADLDTRVDTLRWGGCSSGLPSSTRCATLSVPRDWGDRSVSGTYGISVAKIPAGNPAKRLGVLTFNPGGPGSTAVSNIGWVYSLLPKRVKQRFDLVAWDPRGVGGSQPYVSGCTVKDVSPPATGPVDWEGWTEKYMRVVARRNAECLAANRSEAPYLGTWQLAHDIDALRKALGEDSLTFWGMSYGTTVGRAYAQLFPQRVRALLLDGTISPISTIELWAREHTWDDPAAIAIALAALGPKYERRYERVMTALDTRTLADGSGGRTTRWEVGRSIISWASYQTTWGSIARLLDALNTSVRTGSRAAASRAAELITAAGTGKSWFDPQWTYVNCSDMRDRPSAATLARIAADGAAAGGAHIGQSVLREGAQCAGLPALGRPLRPITTPITLTTPPLVSNSLGDNRTPWSAAQEMTAAFTGAKAIQYGGTHHIVYGRTTSCVHKPITRYLVTLTLPRQTVRCPLEW